MTTIELVLLGVALTGGASVLLAIQQLWAIGGSAEAPVGPWKSKRPDRAKDPEIPREFRTLIWGESDGWRQTEQWQALMSRLDRLEVELGGAPQSTPPPDEYSAQWLEHRIAQLERLSGPLPSPMPPSIPLTQSRQSSRWKKA